MAKTKAAPISRFVILSPLTFAIGIFLTMAVASALVKPTPAVTSQPIPSPVHLIPSPTPLPYPLPVKSTQAIPPWLNARGAIALDITSHTVLYELNADARLLPASTTKITTALVARELYSPDELVTVTNANESVGSKAELQPGEVFTVEELLEALLIDSGNDAAVTLAEHYSQGYTAFVEKMNQKVSALGLTNTHYVNASGIESPYHYSSARDLALLGELLMQDPLLKTIVGTRSATITDHHYGYRLKLQTTNDLLGTVPGVLGIKTGWTQLSGDCLVTYIDRSDHPLILVLLGSTDRFGETKTLIDWIYQNYQWLGGPQS